MDHEFMLPGGRSIRIPSRPKTRVVPEETARELLREWYHEWVHRDDMPAKMANALHVRTALFLEE